MPKVSVIILHQEVKVRQFFNVKMLHAAQSITQNSRSGDFVLMTDKS